MTTIDPQKELERLQKVYGGMVDGELVRLGEAAAELTDEARSASEGRDATTGISFQPIRLRASIPSHSAPVILLVIIVAALATVIPAGTRGANRSNDRLARRIRSNDRLARKIEDLRKDFLSAALKPHNDSISLAEGTEWQMTQQCRAGA